ncbi:hypothetical protein [uncultured Gelidibacter sp.]|uniref:hypothetical protein n=1 Tax=uncultured Gelidibacter sp. TaxID=259318 RepID=UPI002634403F|nr:hypothetical protein [uncultured Gelidibacter sp.]
MAQRIAIDGIDKFTDNSIFKVDASKSGNWKASDKIVKGLYNNIFLSTKLVSNQSKISALTNLNFQLGTAVCRNPNEGKIIILFTDNSKLTLEQASDIKCDDNLDIEYYLGKSLSDIEETLFNLSNKDMDSFRVYFAKGYKDFAVLENKRQIIKDNYKLIFERSKI